MQTRLQSASASQFALAAAAPFAPRAFSPWYRRPSPAPVALAGAVLVGALALLFAAWLPRKYWSDGLL